jgi:hypothetical protein
MQQLVSQARVVAQGIDGVNYGIRPVAVIDEPIHLLDQLPQSFVPPVHNRRTGITVSSQGMSNGMFADPVSFVRSNLLALVDLIGFLATCL